MGLDNGLRIKGKTIKGKNFLNQYCKEIKDEYDPNWYDLGYWRKCWNIRQRFLDVFKDRYNEDEQEIKFKISDIPIIVNDVLKYFLDENNWNYNNSYSQIFDWYEELPSIANAIHNLLFLIEDIERAEDPITDEDIEISFYDSY